MIDCLLTGWNRARRRQPYIYRLGIDATSQRCWKYQSEMLREGLLGELVTDMLSFEKERGATKRQK